MLQYQRSYLGYMSISVLLSLVKVPVRRTRWSDSACISVLGWKNTKIWFRERFKGEIFKTTFKKLALNSFSFLVGKGYPNWTPSKMPHFFQRDINSF